MFIIFIIFEFPRESLRDHRGETFRGGPRPGSSLARGSGPRESAVFPQKLKLMVCACALANFWLTTRTRLQVRLQI